MTYDPANNNRLSTIGSSPVTYDAAGNLTSDGTGVGSHTYEWDAEGRVVSIDGLPGQACQATWIACYTYNALGQRAETAAGAAFYEFVSDPAGNDVGRHDRGGSFLRQYLFQGDGRFGKYQDGITYLMHWNNLGSTGTVADQMGVTTQDQLYYPWGQQRSQIGAHTDLHFATMWQEPESGLFSTHFRRYSSNLGRWLSPDPSYEDILNPQSLNRYAYVLNHPTNSIDPLGLICVKGHCPGDPDPVDPFVDEYFFR